MTTSMTVALLSRGMRQLETAKAQKCSERLCSFGHCHNSEAVVHAEAQQARCEPMVVAGQIERAVVQIDIKVFGLRAPVAGQRDLDAAARGPAKRRARLLDAARKILRAQRAVGEAHGSVQQDVVHGRSEEHTSELQ